MNGGVPINFPVSVRSSLSFGREMPKSMTLGPSSASSTLLGLRSRCTTPARWMSRRASASPAMSRRNCPGGMGPFRLTCSARVGPGMKRVAIQGRALSVSASTTGAVKAPLTCRAAATSCLKRPLNSGSFANSACTTFTASRSPEVEVARWTTPMPPEPRHDSRRYWPEYSGSSASAPDPVPRCGAMGPPPCCFGRSRDARSLVDDAYGTEAAC